MCGIDQGREWQTEQDIIKNIKSAYNDWKQLLSNNVSQEDLNRETEEYHIKNFIAHMELSLIDIAKMNCSIGKTIPPIECRGSCEECYAQE